MAQAIDVPQEAHCCCECGDGRCGEPAIDSRGHLCPRFSWAPHDACGVPRHFPDAGGRRGRDLVASGRAVGDAMPSPVAGLVSVASSPGESGHRGSTSRAPDDAGRSWSRRISSVSRSVLYPERPIGPVGLRSDPSTFPCATNPTSSGDVVSCSAVHGDT